MDTPITRAEHEEFRRTVESEFKRLAEENKRQNERLKIVEENTQRLNDLTIAVNKMSENLITLNDRIEQESHQNQELGARLSSLEEVPAKKWERVANKVLDTITGTVAQALITALAVVVANQLIK